MAQPTRTAVVKQRPAAGSVGSDAGNWDAGREAPTLPTDEHELSPLLTQIFSISKKCPTFMSIIFALLLVPLSLGILFFSCYCKQHFLNFSLSLLTASTRKYNVYTLILVLAELIYYLVVYSRIFYTQDNVIQKQSFTGSYLKS